MPYLRFASCCAPHKPLPADRVMKKRRIITDDPRIVDFNTILMILNGIITLAAIAVSSTSTSMGGYTDWLTNLWAIVLGVQTHVVLALERRSRNPLVVITALVMIAYFSLRIVTLNLYATSTALSRFLCTPQGINQSLIFIILANFALYAGLMIMRIKTAIRTEPGSWRASAASRGLALVLMSIVVIYSPLSAKFGSIPILSIAATFLSQNIVITMAMVYYMLFRKTIPPIALLIIIILILGEAALHFLAGSRSAVHALLVNYLIVALAINGTIRFSKKITFIGLALFPIFLPVAMESFSLSTYIRSNKENSRLQLKESAEISKEYRLAGVADSDLEIKLTPLFDRIGFFDYSADLIINRDRYSVAINPSAYVRSIVDNLLTPGFDIFDQPKIGNSLRAVYDQTRPTTKADLMGGYQSDQLGLYGELFVLFGYFSIPIFFIVGFLVNALYSGVSSSDPFMRVIKRLIILVTFMNLLNSFGFDWVLIDLVFLTIGMALFNRSIFLRCRSQIGGSANRGLKGILSNSEPRLILTPKVPSTSLELRTKAVQER
jgi:hypothetical protein